MMLVAPANNGKAMGLHVAARDRADTASDGVGYRAATSTANGASGRRVLLVVTRPPQASIADQDGAPHTVYVALCARPRGTKMVVTPRPPRPWRHTVGH